MTRRCCWCGSPLRRAQRFWCGDTCRQAGFQATFRRRHRGESYRAWRVRQGLAWYCNRKLMATPRRRAA